MRLLFTAPLSILAHTLHRTAPARSWLALGEPHRGTVSFFANTDGCDWRYPVLQAVHELAEATLHSYHGVTADDIAASDFALLDAYDTARNPALLTPAHVTAVTLETALAVALEIHHIDYASVTRNQLRHPPHNYFTRRNSGEEERAMEAAFADIRPKR